ncbi:MAG: SDR family oxidoreductase [Bryobacterales bacterium]|nr:SDR family oxidoreductase [Bryobacteraceae bacterium]MDW8354141.1 SDR family oxidoreductase [Bryobacterales bacterium]
MTPFTLEGRTALVTGAGRGIGRAIAEKLSGAGAAVLVNDLDEAAAQETAAWIRAAGGRSEALVGDVTEAAFPQRLVEAALDAFGSLDIIVNNAGYTWDNVIQKTTDEQFQAMLDIHVVAPFRILRAASTWIRETAKREIAEGRRVMRKVVNITSISGVDGNAGQAGYSAGKAAVIGLTKTLAKEWGRYNVNVNGVAFGIIETRLTQPLGEETVEVRGRRIPVGVRAEALATLRAMCPLGRFGTPEEAAGPVLFFCSPLSDYVTGEVLVCSGGLRF